MCAPSAPVRGARCDMHALLSNYLHLMRVAQLARGLAIKGFSSSDAARVLSLAADIAANIVRIVQHTSLHGRLLR